MAARENQGLQIALIIFVMLTILLSVSTYMLFSKFQETDGKLKTASAEKDAAVAKKADSDKDVVTLKTLIGSAPTDETGAIVAEKQKMIVDTYGSFGLAALPPDQQTLSNVIKGLGDTVKKSYVDVDSRQKQIDLLKDQMTSDATKAAAKLKEVETALATAQADLDKERQAYAASVAELKKTEDQLVNDKSEKNKHEDDLKAGYERRMAELLGKVATAEKEVRRIREILDKYSVLDPSATGGRITWVNQRENIAYINLGWEDGLRRRISFSVYPPGTTNVEKAVAKGKIEVLNVTGPHLAEAKITENPLNDPLLPDDMIHTQGWHPGQHEHFGICGFINVDGNGDEQTNKLRDVILANGGIVDSWLNEKAAVTGAMTVNTRYLVQGELSADKPAAAERIKGSTTMLGEAKRLGIEVVGLQKFLNMMGYTATSGAGSGVAAAQAAGGNGGAGNGDFRPRTPPARGKDDGAF